jgi:hypothetical protein
MNAVDATFQRALSKLLVEVFEGPPGDEAYVLDPGTPGLLRQLDSIDARTASTRNVPGKTTIASHADHVHFGMTLMNRWAKGEPTPWADADWSASWQRTVVSDQQWQILRDGLRQEFDKWRDFVATKKDWDDFAAAGALAIAVHTAYHLGAIRQILATFG